MTLPNVDMNLLDQYHDLVETKPLIEDVDFKHY